MLQLLSLPFVLASLPLLFPFGSLALEPTGVCLPFVFSSSLLLFDLAFVVEVVVDVEDEEDEDVLRSIDFLLFL